MTTQRGLLGDGGEGASSSAANGLLERIPAKSRSDEESTLSPVLSDSKAEGTASFLPASGRIGGGTKA